MASDLRFVAVELKREFERQSPDIQIEPTFGSSGNLFAQISNKAPFDVFLSADIQYPEKLADQGLAKKETLFRYAIGHIVLWVRKDSKLPLKEQGADVLKSPEASPASDASTFVVARSVQGTNVMPMPIETIAIVGKMSFR